MIPATEPLGTGLDLSNRVALITGAARGLGQAEALALAERGAKVFAVDVLDTGDTVDAIRLTGGQASGMTIDLSQPDSAGRAFEAVLDAYGRVDILVNNAGMIRDRMSFNLSIEDWDQVLAVNLSATFHLAQEVARYWRAQDSIVGRRAILNTSSESGLYGNIGQANYVAAKAGVAALTLALASELARYGIRVNAIAPRARTPMSEHAFGDLPGAESFDPFAPEHVAAVATWLVSDAAAGITGQVLVAHGAGVDVMRTWSASQSIRRTEPWTDQELLSLQTELFPGGDAWAIVEPIGELFTASGNWGTA